MLAVLTALACTCDAAGAGKPVQVFDPVNLRSTVQTEFSLKFEWAAGSTSIVGYKVAYAVSPTVPALSSAISVGNVTSYWLPDIAPSTSYNFKVWVLDKKGKTSPGVMVTGTTSALPTDYLSYVRHDGHTLSHATYDPVNDRVYATGMPGWNLTARDPLDLNCACGRLARSKRRDRHDASLLSQFAVRLLDCGNHGLKRKHLPGRSWASGGP